MTWTIEYTLHSQQDMRRLSSLNRKRVIDYLERRVLELDNPRQLGKSLKGEFSNYWRYRVGDLRIICHIDDGRLIVLVISVGNRREIYR
ncbi:MAG: type II toxin-antitoxin system RelE/ParE family toxin [Hyphomicrobiaceae bacterium]|nr:type II toxin-antitoxin system RelE/ParE family toxin [Hyphomicrobiaceae bacterium]